MLAFHVTIHARPAVVEQGPRILLRGCDLLTVRLVPAELVCPFAVSFEEAANTMGRLPQMLVEPDGSFVWTSPHGAEPWQVDGSLFDRAGRVHYVELAGRCPFVAFDRLQRCLGWPSTRFLFQLSREAILLEAAEFRQYAAS